MYRLLFGLLLSIFYFGPQYALAQAPAITLGGQLRPDGRRLSLNLTPASSAAGCAYTLYGSGKATDFEDGGSGGRALVTFPAAEAVTKRNAKNLQLIRRSPSKAYFRAQLNCAGQSSLSNVLTVNLKRGRSGQTSVGRWLRALGTVLSATDISLNRAFPNLTFSEPLALVSPNDGSGRLFAVEQGGKIYVFTNNDSVTTRTLFLDVSSLISTGSELGLLGLAFHPQFAQNGKFYINYTELRPGGSSLSRSVIAAYTVSPSTANVADSGSEQRLIILDQPFDNHNGGDLAFGPDGYLYIGFGDGGSGGDPQGNGQNRATLLGKMLRIDVDAQEGQLAYAIPATNPYKANVQGFREEIFAYGFRNPFRFSFDAPSGRLWVGDVGQGAREELDLVTSGGNYGWNIMEGSQCYPPGSSCSRDGLVLPITDYGRSVGTTIIGGYVYRGRLVPNLKEYYIFGDFGSGTIFSLLYDGVTATRQTLLSTDLNISSFGRDENGEVYVVSYGDGRIYRIGPG
jgi:glucose/arabinose dehydrogenase